MVDQNDIFTSLDSLISTVDDLATLYLKATLSTKVVATTEKSPTASTSYVEATNSTEVIITTDTSPTAVDISRKAKALGLTIVYPTLTDSSFKRLTHARRKPRKHGRKLKNNDDSSMSTVY